MLEADDRGLLVELAETVDPQALLAAAQDAGPVTHFSRAVPTLADIFTEVAR